MEKIRGRAFAATVGAIQRSSIANRMASVVIKSKLREVGDPHEVGRRMSNYALRHIQASITGGRIHPNNYRRHSI